jgi:hypothetical protein
LNDRSILRPDHAKENPRTSEYEMTLSAKTLDHVLEILLAIAVKTLSNYSNHLFHTPLDGMFAGHEWRKPGVGPGHAGVAR